MKLIEFVNAFNVLAEIGKTAPRCSDTPEDVRISYQIAKLISKMDSIVTSFQKAQNVIAERYKAEGKFVMDGEKPKIFEDGTSRILPQYIASYQKEITDLGITEVEQEDIPTFKFKYSVLARNFNISSREWLAIMPFVNDDEDDEPPVEVVDHTEASEK